MVEPMKTLIRFLFALWCGWVIVQAPYVGVRKKLLESDATRPIYEWEVATVTNRPGFFFDTGSSQKQRHYLSPVTGFDLRDFFV
jgi:hypothetical protein